MHTFILTEEQVKAYTEAQDVINELVYVNGVKGNKANLTYDSGNTAKHKGNLSQIDKIQTDKMDQNNADTYEVPLKGGIMSYNITSIIGKEVMHYFKRYFDSEKTTMKIQGNEYELTMKENEFKHFLNNFKSKVWNVISHCIKEYKNSGEKFKPRAISIFPVQSSSNFNEKMTDILSHGSINGLPCQKIDANLLLKDTRNLEKDTEFIEKNKEYYSGRYYSDVDKMNKNNYSTVEQNVDSQIERTKKINELRWCAKMLDESATELINLYYRYNVTVKTNDEKKINNVVQQMLKAYRQYYGCYEYLNKELKNGYHDENGKLTDIYRSSLVEPIKSTKGPSVEKRTEAIWSVLKPYFRNNKSDITNAPFKSIPIYQYKELPFQIKTLSDPVRMGVRNIYNPNEDEEFVKKEVEKTLGTVFVIFDDNISGGATLSDICYQLKKLGIEHIIPITFGQMSKKTTDKGVAKINTPKNGYNLNEELPHSTIESSSR